MTTSKLSSGDWGMLGFHAGKRDGIFGPQTERALREFQLNFGLAVDGQCGRATLLGLDQVGSMSDGSAASVREREGLRSDPRLLASRRLYVAADPELARLGSAVAWHVPSGARVLLGSGRPDSTLAEEANRYEADVVIALRAGDEPGSRVTYFATPTFRSERGYSLAVRIAEELERDFGPVASCGRAYGILRETRMAAVEYQPAGEDDPARVHRKRLRLHRAGRRDHHRRPSGSKNRSRADGSASRRASAAVGRCARRGNRPVGHAAVDALEVLEVGELDDDPAAAIRRPTSRR